ncbi:MAG: alpha-xylosidase, partial [Clostridia bacterium]|nr:alpha-xylosidase [Clostridia bacterium]
DNILVAPIFNEEGTAEFYVPAGKWTDIISGKQYEGGKFYNEKFDYFSLPCLAKPNSIVAYGNFEKNFEYDYLTNTEFVIYELEEGKTAECNIYNTEAEKIFTLTATNNGGKIEVSYTNTTSSFKIKVFGKDAITVNPTSEGKVIINL